MSVRDLKPSAILLAPYHDLQVVCLYIDNLADLFAAYGTEPIRQMLDEALPHRLAGLGISSSDISRVGDHAIIDLTGADSPSALNKDVLLERIKAAVSYLPCECGSDRILLKVLVTLGAPQFCLEAPPFGTSRYFAHAWPSAQDEVHPINAKRDAFREDMALAVKFFDDLNAGQITLAFQRIVAASELNTPIYDEALLRRLDGDQAMSCYPEIQALERLGLIDRLDRSVMWTVFEILERHPAISVGANVSALSLRHDGWWRIIQDYLAQHADIADRLTLEITETSAITNAEEAANLLLSLRVMGCRIALDDMGAGYSTISFLAATRPDIVKIDRTFVTQSTGQLKYQALLAHFVTFCADLSACVIVEGIETADDLAVAVRAGAHGLQGFFLGYPEVSQPWLNITVRVRDGFEPGHRALDPNPTCGKPRSDSSARIH